MFSAASNLVWLVGPHSRVTVYETRGKKPGGPPLYPLNVSPDLGGLIVLWEHIRAILVDTRGIMCTSSITIPHGKLSAVNDLNLKGSW